MKGKVNVYRVGDMASLEAIFSDLFSDGQDSEPTEGGSALDVQEGGDHYKKMGRYQPWEVAGATFSPEELKGAMKITVLSYLLREADKGGMGDIRKAAHTMQIYLELAARAEAKQIADGEQLPEASPETEGQCNTERECGACWSGQGECAQTAMKFDPATGAAPFPGPYEPHEYRAYHGPAAWLYNPYTGHLRDSRDIGTDVLGHLIEPVRG